MKVLFINVICGIKSTGRITTDTAEHYETQGHECKIAYGRGNVPVQYSKYAVCIGSKFDEINHGILTRLFDLHGCGSKRSTKNFLKWADKYNPDLLWMHNLHGYYLNYSMVFRWIKSRPNMQVRWTLHDCWSFTGHCTYFTWAGCEKWKSQCSNCIKKSEYPASWFRDKSSKNYMQKKASFTGVKNMTIITPSQWLADLVQQSFLKEYRVQVVYNTINTNVFKPTPSKFRKQYGFENKIIVLGVASDWSKRKGIEDFIKLAAKLEDRFVMVMVGLSKKQIKKMPKRFICIRRTDSTSELAAIYSAADVFVNLTYEDTYPTVNLEAQACGTRIITYDTGGSKETIWDMNSAVVPTGDLNRVIEILNDMTVGV